MKLSEYKNEEAIEVLADILDPVTDILADEVIKAEFSKEQPVLKKAKALLKRKPKQIVEILARLDNVPVEEYECSILTLPARLIEILNDKDLIDFFASQGQTTESGFSGSATVNTEGTEKK